MAMKTGGEYATGEDCGDGRRPAILRPFCILAVIFRSEPGAPQTWPIVKWEIIGNLKNFKIPIVFATMILMLPISAHLMAFDYRHRLDNWMINQVSQRDPVTGGRVRYDLSDGSFVHSELIGHGPPIQRPQPLSALIKGMDGEMNRTASVGQRIRFGDRQDEPATSSIFDTPDTSFMIKLLVSLFALLLSFDAVTREKEAGTLKAILAHPIRRRRLILNKSFGASISLLVPYALAYSIEIAYFYLSHGLVNNKEEMMRALLIFGLGALYGIVFVHIGLFISTITTRSKIAVAAAMLTWGAVVLVLPNAAVLMAKLLAPAPSYNQFNVRLHEARQRILYAESQNNPADKTLPGLQASRQAMFRIFEVERQLTDDYLASKKTQIRCAQVLAALSPSGALTFGLSDLANTGVGAYNSYLELLRSDRDVMLDALERRLDLPSQAGNRLVQETSERIEDRQRNAEPLGASLRSALISIASLLVWAVLFGSATYWRFERYDVR